MYTGELPARKSFRALLLIPNGKDQNTERGTGRLLQS